MPNRILLASHGTVGAQAAEQALVEICSAHTEVTHLYVVPDFWQHILGDDWLNNQITRERFGDYLESELAQEAEDTISRVRELLEGSGTKSKYLLLFGDPQKCLVSTCMKQDIDLVITGSPRPKFIPGLRSRMTTESLKQHLSIPHLQVTHPNTKH